tara:strand:- start:5155 stop:5997 length:843 start_codon:yes stop_codon:yes gene_type:complete
MTNIPWKIKSTIFGLIDFFKAPRALYFLQKYVTGRSKVRILQISPDAKEHKKYLERYNSTENIFEFGAGKNLAQNLFISDIVANQIVVDLNPMIDFELVENVRRQISELVVLKSQLKISSLDELSLYGIEYRAPYDASKTDFNDKSFSACISTNTLEHIPKDSITAIFSELFRTLKDDGIVSAKIDYSDHYAHTDKSISLLNYLKFDDETWKRYNHNCHYQNRLRHSDYVDIFKRCGFVVIEEDLSYAEENIPAEIAEAFRDKDATWRATSAHIILKKAL